MTSVAAKVAKHKEAHPELYCPVKKCLWKTGGGRCVNHEPMNTGVKGTLKLLEQIENGVYDPFLEKLIK
jgi:hypothetical protein